MIECPFCIAEIDDSAVACRHCGRDLTGQIYLLRKVALLQTEVAELTAQFTQTRIVSSSASSVAQPEPARSSGAMVGRDIGALVGLALCPATLLIVAHYLLALHFELPPIALLLATLLIPLPFGYLAITGTTRGLIFWGTLFLITSLVSVLIMGVTTYWMVRLSSDYVPEMEMMLSPLPQTSAEWLQDFRFAFSIFFSFVTGMLLGVLYINARQSNHSKIAVLRTDVALLRRGLVRIVSAQTMERISKYATAISTIASTAGAIYFGISKL
ncbi:hypothetical protein [Sphingomonas sp. R86520]|uniref:hypothetical protein n=1 Tax=Sphingomonas sp. R86520 TaxID=3093859 RepID=UPI0036D39BF7